jgi:hypothetical protein
MTKPATKKQRSRWEIIRALGCIATRHDIPCGRQAAIHHCETGMGGRKNHDKVIPLCHFHHQGEQGIHTIGRKAWQEKYRTEQELMALLENT